MTRNVDELYARGRGGGALARAACLALTLSLATCTRAPVARAQSSDSVEPAKYREAIRVAIEEYETQSYVEAREHFRRAHALFPTRARCVDSD